MAYYSLPLERRIDEIANEYLYITVIEYPEGHFKPDSKKKSLTKEQKKEKDECISNHHETIHRLDSGYFNTYNRPVELRTILESYTPTTEDDFKGKVIYRIKPTASKVEQLQYSNIKKYFVNEFDVINKITTIDELNKQLIADNLIRRFAAEVFDKYSYNKEGYSDLLVGWFNNIKASNPDVIISLSDIVLQYDSYYGARSKFIPNRYYDISGKNLKTLLDNGLIDYKREYEYVLDEVVVTLIGCGLSGILYEYIKHLSDDYQVDTIKTSKKVADALRLHMDNVEFKEIVKILGINVGFVRLKITKRSAYRDDSIVDKTFSNINEVKMFLIKEYDVPFDRLTKNDISKIEHSQDEDTYFEFEIM